MSETPRPLNETKIITAIIISYFKFALQMRVECFANTYRRLISHAAEIIALTQ